MKPYIEELVGDCERHHDNLDYVTPGGNTLIDAMILRTVWYGFQPNNTLRNTDNRPRWLHSLNA